MSEQSTSATKTARKPKSEHRVKYQCPSCESILQGKEGLNLLCVECGLPLEKVTRKPSGISQIVASLRQEVERLNMENQWLKERLATVESGET